MASDVLSSAPLLAQLSQIVDEKPEDLYAGSSHLQHAALHAAKYIFELSVQSESMSRPYLETLLSSVNPSEAPQTRSQSRKRKRSLSPPPIQVSFQQTPIESLFVDGMNEDQIWSQLDLRTNSICHVLDNILSDEAESSHMNDVLESNEEDEDFDDDKKEDDDEMGKKLWEAMQRIKNGENVDLDGLGLDESMQDLLVDLANRDDSEDDESLDDEGDWEEDISEEDAENVEERVALRDPSSDSEEEEESRSLMDVITSKKRKKKSTRNGGHPELDDDFFDLNAFNVQTEQAGAKNASSGRLDDEDDAEDEVDVDLFAPIDLEGSDEEDPDNTTSMIFYNDFFKPPKRAKQPPKSTSVRFQDEVRVKKIKAKGKNFPVSSMYEEQDEDDESDGHEGEEVTWGVADRDPELESSSEDEGGAEEEAETDDSDDAVDDQRGAISRVRDDLFADEDDDEAQQDLTTHERRMAALKKEIMELEADNVGPKDWVLMGEADSRSRPQNSLLEEDLEFDRVMKSVPVITEDVVKSLEERIKARILEDRFDDVVRIRPLEDKPFLPSRFFELKDTKSTQSLAQIYEDEYVAAQPGGVAGEDRDDKLKKEHDEVEKLWENISNKLDALCNAHFTPKQPKATISTISNVSTASMESALPTAKSVSTMLAPEEVFALSSSDLRARSELTPAEKQALHRKERKAKKKARDTLDKSTDKYARAQKGGSLKKQKEDALKSVVKAGKGVTVVGKTKKDVVKKETKSKRRAEYE
ncbi:hypothetical protein D9757_002897 [Collybiopsis confluens]|uniref:U3 small nucleolar ribonucleoprotein protein MPP10 n=1 Tax=Collybiopsis confluens TaxID=2823264 RepID=A0A8H5HVL7_9AGAR|nr:hypothetical protein D9757_002897 [Collybiopsis confluens]